MVDITNPKINPNEITDKKLKNKISSFKDSKKNTIEAYYLKPLEAFGINTKIITDNIIFINNTKILFISGFNLSVYDLITQQTQIIIRKSVSYSITSMSVGFKSDKECFICIGEYNYERNKKQISLINFFDNKIQYILHNKNSQTLSWKIFLAKILKNSSNCISVAKKEIAGNQSQLSFWKFTQELLISEVLIEEDILNFSFNPKNTHEIVLCGKNYLRLWNVFVNQGILKEHPQRFLKNKQEKEHTFINIEFFEKKSFMLIVGTLENEIFIIEGFVVIAVINAMYKKENIYDLNIHNQIIENDLLEDKLENVNNYKLKFEDSPMNFHKIHKIKTFSDENFLRSVKLVGNNMILIAFQNDSISYINKLEKELKNGQNKNDDSGSEDSINKNKGNQEDIKVNRLANNIKQIINFSVNEDGSKIIYFVEIFGKEDKNDTNYRLYLFNRKDTKLIFEKEIFRNYVYKHKIKNFGVNEKKNIFFSITENNIFRCFDYENSCFLMQHKFNEEAREIISCPNNNVLGISFQNKYSFYFILKDKLVPFMDFDMVRSTAKFSEKGEYIAIGGINPITKMHVVLFFDSFNFNTLHAIEDVKSKAKKILWVDNDKFIFVLYENNQIRGYSLSLEYLSINLINRFRDRGRSVNSAFISMIYKHVTKSDYNNFEYDLKNDLLIVTYNELNKLSVINKKGTNIIITLDFDRKISSIKLIIELKCLLIGFSSGELKVFKWPFENLENTKSIIVDNLMFQINLHTEDIIDIHITNNLKTCITSSTDGSVYLNGFFIQQNKEYKYFNKFSDFEKQKPKIETYIKISDLFEYIVNEIRSIDFRIEKLNKNKNYFKKTNKDKIEIKKTEFEKDLQSLEDQKNEATYEENKRYESIMDDIRELKINVETELNSRQNDHNHEKNKLQLKYEQKLTLYKIEIDRLNLELKDLQTMIEEKFKNLATHQVNSFNNLFNGYMEKLLILKDSIEKNIEILVKTTAEYDDAYEISKNDYDKMIQKLKDDMTNDIESAKRIIEDKEFELDRVFMEENSFKNILDKKVVESDEIIKKNVQIKQNIIDTTQRSITLQEQLLETEKNLIKIDKKMDDLGNKNKHLEQIRFVLEHRMTSLEKEKAPLEDQCYFLENQKYNLQNEFNRLILEINKKNQVLENRQSQLKACLMQNFEINDHINYMKKKLNLLQGEVSNFIKKYNKENSSNLSIQDNKTTIVALDLKDFYNKFFEANIDDELINYKYFSKKLQEESDKVNLANNVDLIMRDKAEEKLINEKSKMDQIEIVKEKGFKRMQDENTILISECNRLRKNLHEVYMHVVDIEGKFEDLTKINPSLNKTEIVNQIKHFIQKTQGKIKQNYNDQSFDVNSSTFYKKENSKFDDYIEENSKIFNNGNLLKNMKDNENNLNDQKSNLEAINNQIKKAVTPQINYDDLNKNDYENFLILPEIKYQNTLTQNNEINENNSIYSNKNIESSVDSKNEDLKSKNNLPVI